MSVGSSAKQAIQFLKTFYRDVHSMVVACEQLLGEQGWKPPKSSQIAELSNSLNRPHRWVLDSVFRSFIRPGKEAAHDAVILLVLLNAKHFDDAQVLAVRAQFGKPVTHERIWDRWTNATRVLDFLMTNPAALEIPPDAYRDGALPDAERVRGFTVSLDKLTDEAAVRTLLIEPLLRLS